MGAGVASGGQFDSIRSLQSRSRGALHIAVAQGAVVGGRPPTGGYRSSSGVDVMATRSVGGSTVDYTARDHSVIEIDHYDDDCASSVSDGASTIADGSSVIWTGPAGLVAGAMRGGGRRGDGGAADSDSDEEREEAVHGF